MIRLSALACLYTTNLSVTMKAAVNVALFRFSRKKRRSRQVLLKQVKETLGKAVNKDE